MAYTGYEPSRRKPRILSCGTPAQRPRHKIKMFPRTLSCRSRDHWSILVHVARHPPFQDSVTSRMSSLINQRDGCLQMVARQTSQGRLRQKRISIKDSQKKISKIHPATLAPPKNVRRKTTNSKSNSTDVESSYIFLTFRSL